MSLANIAKSHKFTSDDTITEYAKEIWELKKQAIAYESQKR